MSFIFINRFAKRVEDIQLVLVDEVNYRVVSRLAKYGRVNDIRSDFATVNSRLTASNFTSISVYSLRSVSNCSTVSLSRCRNAIAASGLQYHLALYLMGNSGSSPVT